MCRIVFLHHVNHFWTWLTEHATAEYKCLSGNVKESLGAGVGVALAAVLVVLKGV